MASNLSDDEDEITGINVTPLVDVMLVLLIIFMVTTSYIVNRSININLPKASTAENQTTQKNLAFVLDKQGQLYLDGKLINFADLQQQIAEIKKQRTDGTPLQALITADTETSHGQVVKLIDAVRKNGINDFAINVEIDNDSPAAQTSKAHQ